MTSNKVVFDSTAGRAYYADNLMPRFRSLTRFLLLALCVALMVHSACALSSHRAHKQAKEEIQDLEQEWRAATLASDAISLGGLLSDDYVGISWTGQVNTKSMQLDRTRSKSLAFTQLQLSNIRIQLLGRVAIVTGQADVAGLSGSEPMQGVFRYTRVYQHLPSGWKITNFEVTRVPHSGHIHLTDGEQGLP